MKLTPETAHDFFVASAGVAGALIGLLFVAISVSPERVLGPDAPEAGRIRAAATLTAFTNALCIGLFGLVPGLNLGIAATVTSIVGLLFVGGSLALLLPSWRAQGVRPRDITFLVGQLVIFVLQLLAGLSLDRHPGGSEDLQTLCILVIVCFLVGISRAWELVGGPRISLTHQIAETVRHPHRPPARDDDPPA
jgi:hypothetical protein